MCGGRGNKIGTPNTRYSAIPFHRPTDSNLAPILLRAMIVLTALIHLFLMTYLFSFLVLMWFSCWSSVSHLWWRHWVADNLLLRKHKNIEGLATPDESDDVSKGCLIKLLCFLNYILKIMICLTKNEARFPLYSSSIEHLSQMMALTMGITHYSVHA